MFQQKQMIPEFSALRTRKTSVAGSYTNKEPISYWPFPAIPFIPFPQGKKGSDKS